VKKFEFHFLGTASINMLFSKHMVLIYDLIQGRIMYSYCPTQLSDENKLVINLLELHTEYKIVIEYGTKYKCTDFIASSTSILSILVIVKKTFYFRKRVIWNQLNLISKVLKSLLRK